MDIGSLWPLIYLAVTVMALNLMIRKYRRRRPHVIVLDVEQLLEWQERGAEIWDVRSVREQEMGMPKGFLSRPHGTEFPELEPSVELACVCTSGVRAMDVAETMKKRGLKRVGFLEGGVADLKEVEWSDPEEADIS